MERVKGSMYLLMLGWGRDRMVWDGKSGYWEIFMVVTSELNSRVG